MSRIVATHIGKQYAVLEDSSATPALADLSLTVGDNEFLAVQFVRALHPSSNDRMTFRRITANDENEISLLHVRDGTRISAIAQHEIFQ